MSTHSELRAVTQKTEEIRILADNLRGASNPRDARKWSKALRDASSELRHLTESVRESVDPPEDELGMLRQENTRMRNALIGILFEGENSAMPFRTPYRSKVLALAREGLGEES